MAWSEDPESETARTARGRPGVDGMLRLRPRDLLADPGLLVDVLRLWLERQADAEAAARTGFHLMPVGLIAGALAAIAGGWRPIPVVAAVSAALLLLAAWRIAERPWRRNALLAAGFVFLGAALALVEEAWTTTTIISGTATTRIAGVVAERSRDDRGRYRYVVDIAATARPTLSRPPERARILVASRHEPIAPGEAFYALVRLGPPSGPAYPGGYDFAYSPFFDGLGAYGFSLGAPSSRPSEGSPAIGPGGGPGAVAIWLARLREAMTERIRAVIPGPEGAVAAALITGERDGIPDDVADWFRSTGIAHVLAISGLHLAIVTGAAMALVRSLIALLPGAALRIPAKKVAAAIALAVAALYLGISGANVATQRAFVMLAIMLVAVIVDRPALTIRNVSIAATIVIVLAPHVVTTASFQLSFAATAALVAAYGAFARRRQRQLEERRARKARSPLRLGVGALGGIVATSLIAGAATAPFAAYHFQQAAAFGVITNLLTMPLFSFAIMPLALASCLLMPFGLDAWPLELMGAAIGLVLRITHRLYGLLPDQSIGLVSGAGLLLLAAAILAAAFLASQFRWVAVPLAVIGLILAPDRTPRPDLLVFESGREVAALSPDGAVAFLRKRTNAFVADQWERAYRSGASPSAGDNPALRPRIDAKCREKVCSFGTASGLRIVWTDDYRKTGYACDHADVAIVARAIRLTACRSGAMLVTLRTLRETGSLAIRRDPQTGRPVFRRSIGVPAAPWNRHRAAPWPESWHRPKGRNAEAGAREEEQQPLADQPAEPSDPAADNAEDAVPPSFGEDSGGRRE
ncbi:ComEC/Rec2 family competence protein [Jiella sp. M17.18]|uniref:ComEC/Rec2 family competence protein n=1 Tax=Jiella sp. M17.18 TaxID=3234247 RepID=UPI0034DE35F5